MAGEWKVTTIGEQATLQRGIDITKAEQREGKVPVISSGGVSSYHDTAAVKGPGVVLGRKGVVGSVFFVEEDYWPHDTSLWVKDFHGNHPRFVYYFFKSIAPQIARMDVGSANPTLNRNHVHPMPISWPPLAEQKAITAVLGALDDKIELNRRMDATLEAMARALFQSWFVDFDPVRAKLDGRKPEGLDKATAALFPAAFQDSPLGPIPKGWTTGTIDEASSLIIDHRGRTPKKMGSDWSAKGVPAVSAKNVKAGRLVRPDMFNFISEELYGRWMKDRLAIGDILMTSEAPLGELYYLALDAHFCISQRIFAIRANPAHCEPTFLYYWLESPACQAEIINRGTGTTVEGIRQSELRKVTVLLPPMPVQKTAAQFLASWTEQIHRNESQSRTLATLRDTVLPKLLSGELRVASTEQIEKRIAR
jgi:type I restriction enzyme, S subunit